MSEQLSLMHVTKPCPFEVGDIVYQVDSEGNPLPLENSVLEQIRRIRWYFNTWMIAFSGKSGYEVNYKNLVKIAGKRL